MVVVVVVKQSPTGQQCVLGEKTAYFKGWTDQHIHFLIEMCGYIHNELHYYAVLFFTKALRTDK